MCPYILQLRLVNPNINPCQHSWQRVLLPDWKVVCKDLPESDADFDPRTPEQIPLNDMLTSETQSRWHNPRAALTVQATIAPSNIRYVAG